MIEIRNVSFSYRGEAGAAGGIRNVELSIPAGQFVVLCGESGCGKTTLTRLINGLIPHYFEGELTGTVRVKGRDVSAQPLYETAALVGSVFQNPRSQFFNVDTTGEVTFGCENLGLPPEEIRRRLREVTEDFRLEPLLDRNIFQLSGGEKQKIACAGAAILEPEVFVLDEPSSNLDARSIRELRETLARWKARGRTVVISEHRLSYLRGLADRFLYLREGEIAGDYPAADFAALGGAARAAMGLRAYDPRELPPPGTAETAGKTLGLRDFRFAYRGRPETLRIRDCEIPAGEIVAVTGGNGAGKSTFSRCLCGLEKGCGRVIRDGAALRPGDRLKNSYLVMQDVNHQLFTESVLDEVLISMEREDTAEAEAILARLDLLALRDRHPMSLSGGQKQRLAVASALASGRSLLVFDEPTSGLDLRHMHEVAAVLRQLRGAGRSLFVVTHDPELILACCTSVLRFQDGDIVGQYPVNAASLPRIRRDFLLEKD